MEGVKADLRVRQTIAGAGNEGRPAPILMDDQAVRCNLLMRDTSIGNSNAPFGQSAR